MEIDQICRIILYGMMGGFIGGMIGAAIANLIVHEYLSRAKCNKIHGGNEKEGAEGGQEKDCI